MNYRIVTTISPTLTASERGDTVEWAASEIQVGLTDREIQALCIKHKSKSPNLERAQKVKQYMLEGKTCSRIVQILRNQYGERMVKGDHAALKNIKTT